MGKFEMPQELVTSLLGDLYEEISLYEATNGKKPYAIMVDPIVYEELKDYFSDSEVLLFASKNLDILGQYAVVANPNDIGFIIKVPDLDNIN